MMRLFTLFTLLAAATAFTAQPWGVPSRTIATSATARFMFSSDDEAQPTPLTEVSADASATDDSETSSSSESAPQSAVYRNLGAGGEPMEVKWVDPAMAANTNPLSMSWWAYPLFGFPFIVLGECILAVMRVVPTCKQAC